MQFGIHCTCNVITSKSNYIKLFLPNYSYAKFTGPHLKFAKDNDKGNNLDRQVMLLTPEKYKKKIKNLQSVGSITCHINLLHALSNPTPYLLNILVRQ